MYMCVFIFYGAQSRVFTAGSAHCDRPACPGELRLARDHVKDMWPTVRNQASIASLFSGPKQHISTHKYSQFLI